MSSAAEIAQRLGARRSGNGWMARCPAHSDTNPSLSIREGTDGQPWLHCFAGCSYAEIANALRLSKSRHVKGAEAKKPTATDAEQAAGKLAAAKHFWHETVPAEGTPAQRYLRGRGIDIAIPNLLRFHPSCLHPSGSRLPALVAAVADPGLRFRGIHRIFLRADGSGKADIKPSKASLGPVSGAMVPLTKFTSTLFVGEGIETTLSVTAALNGKPHYESYSYAAALSTSGMYKLEIPAVVRELIILADNDEPGKISRRRIRGPASYRRL